MIAFARAKRIDKVIDLFEDTISNLAVASPYRRADEEDPRTSIPRYLALFLSISLISPALTYSVSSHIVSIHPLVSL
jgi:hypothetical protein